MIFSLKNRIAFYYMLATAVIMAVVFSVIFFVVQKTVISNLDYDLSYEAHKHTDEILIKGTKIKFKNKAEWEEEEHREIHVNPVFIQLVNQKGDLMDKSPNLKENFLVFKDLKHGNHFNAMLDNRSIRQVQVPIVQNEEIKGYILAAMSSESEQSVILKLRNTLMLSYIVILLGLYFISRFLAGRSIKPIQEVTNTITQITKNNLNKRVVIPAHRDEIFDLATNFNSLIDRIENAIARERQFTSDASHELRTPLATLRGTLEVLIRKPRTQVEYEEKIKLSLLEISKMTITLEQLLILARLEDKLSIQKNDLIELPTIINESLANFKSKILDKNIKINFHFEQEKELLVPNYYSYLIINNLLSNAIKYSNNESVITIEVEEKHNIVTCSIRDSGIGIKREDLEQIYKNFFRSEPLSHKQIVGTGLGLSIVKKCVDAIQGELKINSKINEGTIVFIKFKTNKIT